MLALSLFLLVLSGCDATEQSAQKVLDETLGDALNPLNEHIDGLQQGVDETLGKPAEDETATEQATNEPSEKQQTL